MSGFAAIPADHTVAISKLGIETIIGGDFTVGKGLATIRGVDILFHPAARRGSSIG